MHTIGFEDNDIRVEIKDGIMYNLYKNGVIIDKEVTSKMISERMKLSNGQSYPLMITFSPSYLIRFPENKKYSWEDLKKIRQKIKELNLKV